MSKFKTIKDLKIKNDVIPFEENDELVYLKSFPTDEQAFLEIIVGLANTEGGWIVLKVGKRKNEVGSLIQNEIAWISIFMETYKQIFDEKYVGKLDIVWLKKEEFPAIVFVRKSSKKIIRIEDDIILYRSENKLKELKAPEIVESTKMTEIRRLMIFQKDRTLEYDPKSSSYFVSTSHTNQEFLYKYMTLDSFMRFIKEGKIMFQEPTGWKDQFEKRFYNADYSKLGKRKNVPRELYATCMTETKDCEAPWKVYANDDKVFGKCVQIKIKLAEFKQQVLDYISPKGWNAYEGKVSYALNQAHILKLHMKGTPYHKPFFQSFNLEKFLALLLIKRPAYEYENEVRFLIVNNNAMPTKTDPKRVLVDVLWEKLIEEVRIDKSCADGEKLVVKQFCESKGIRFVEAKITPHININDGLMEIQMEDFDINAMEGQQIITIDKP